MEYGRARKWIREVALKHVGDSCLTWPFARRKNGYGFIGDGKTTTGAHRFVCQAAHGPPPSPNLDAAHSCGKGSEGCVSPHHLSWKTRSENNEDMVQHGTDTRGSKNAMAKLTESDVLAIRASYARQVDLAAQYGVRQQTISAILRRKEWAWLK